VQRLKTTVGNLLVPGNNAPWQEVRDTLNRSLRGWSNYFCYGTRRSACAKSSTISAQYWGCWKALPFASPVRIGSVR
jgi:hypothetical protein